VVTTAEGLLIDLISAAAIKHSDAISYLKTLPRPWCKKRSHAAWPIVKDTTYLAPHLAGLPKDLGYDRRAKPVEDLTEVLARKKLPRPPQSPLRTP